MRVFFYLFFSVVISTNSFSQSDSGAYFKSFDETKIYYEVKGNGEPVLLVHGFIVNGQSISKLWHICNDRNPQQVKKN